MSANFSIASHHSFFLVLQIETFSFLSFIPPSFTVNSKMDYCKFILTALLCHSSLELYFCMAINLPKWRRKKEIWIEKIWEYSLKFHARLSNVGSRMTEKKGMRIWILMERNYIVNWKITLEIWFVIMCGFGAIKGGVLYVVKWILNKALSLWAFFHKNWRRLK